jgi:hypothetical protein
VPELRDLEQLRYWQGQLMRSRDFRDQAAIDAQKRWWHNRAIHAIFGVNSGLTVNVTTSGGAFGATVACGLAYDCFGRELILQSERFAPTLPAGTDPLTLVLCYSTATAAQLFWKPTSQVRIGDGVPLASVIFATSGPALDAAFRAPLARAIARPRIATGDTVSGNTPWEAWIDNVIGAGGSVTPVTVGVQTHVDSSAAGFTSTPNYFATLQWPSLTPGNESFAAAYFPSIADETSAGFTFRLLMAGISRRRLAVAYGISEAALTPTGALASVTLLDASGFSTGDSVVRLRPRAQTVAMISSAASQVLTLSAPLDGVQKGDVLAIGNLPRTAKVTAVKGAQTVMIVTLAAAIDVQAGDFILKTGPVMPSDPPPSVMDVKGSAVTLDSPIAGLIKGDAVGFARPSQTFSISSVATEAGVMTVTVGQPEAFKVNAIVLRTTGGVASGPAMVSQIVANVLTLSAPITGLSATDVLSIVSENTTAASVASKKAAMQVSVDTPSVFRAGDIVARYDSGAPGSLPVVIDSIDSKTITLANAIPNLLRGDQIGAANPGPTYAVSSVSSLGTAITVATPEAFTAGDVVALMSDSGPSGPVIVDSISDAVLTVRSSIDTLQAGNLLIPARFPRTATAVAVFAYLNYFFVELDSAGVLRVGDLVMRAADAGIATAASLATVIYSGGNFVLISNAIANLQTNDQLAPVWFSVASSVTVAPASSATSLTVDSALDIRPGDVAGPLVAYAETSRPQSIMAIQANKVSLSAPIDGLTAGDLVGPASFSATSNRLRFENVDDVFRGDQLELNGLDTALMQPQSLPMSVAGIDVVNSAATLTPVSGSFAAMRPETLSVAVLFNANFVDSFVSFAQQQGAYLCWLGIQTETQNSTQCPGMIPDPDPCAENAT